MDDTTSKGRIYTDAASLYHYQNLPENGYKARRRLGPRRQSRPRTQRLHQSASSQTARRKFRTGPLVLEAHTRFILNQNSGARLAKIRTAVTSTHRRRILFEAFATVVSASNVGYMLSSSALRDWVRVACNAEPFIEKRYSKSPARPSTCASRYRLHVPSLRFCDIWTSGGNIHGLQRIIRLMPVQDCTLAGPDERR